MSKELIERLKSYIPNGDGYNSQYANDLADAVDALESATAPRKPEGEGLEVVGYVAVPIPDPRYSDWYAVWTREKAAGIGSTPLCRLSDAQRAIAELREECERLRAPTPTCFCGLRMTLNPHPDAGKPERLLEVGAVYVCIPCLNKANHGHCKSANALRQQRDKLAGLLMESCEKMTHELWQRIDAALAEVKPCPESPHPAAT